MLLPGDMFVIKSGYAIGWLFPKSFTVISVDHGDIARHDENKPPRPASIMILTDEQTVDTHSFAFLNYYTKVSGGDRASKQ